MSDLELYDSEKLKAEILQLKEKQQKDGKMASEAISSLQTKLEAAQQQIEILKKELLQTKQKDTEELQLKGMESLYIPPLHLIPWFNTFSC